MFLNGLDGDGVAQFGGYLALMFAHYHRHSYTGCKTAVSEGHCLSGRSGRRGERHRPRGSHVRSKLCDIIQTAELVFAAGEASANHAVEFPSGQWVPDEVLTNAYRRLAGHNIYHEYEILL